MLGVERGNGFRMSYNLVFKSKNKRSGLLGFLHSELGLNQESSEKIYEVAGVLILARFSPKGAKIQEVQLVLDSQVGRDIALYTKENFVDSGFPEIFSEKLALVIPLFEEQIGKFIDLLRKSFD